MLKLHLNLRQAKPVLRRHPVSPAMLQQRRVWAQEEGLNPDVIEKMYTDLVNYFIEEEMKHWQNK